MDSLLDGVASQGRCEALLLHTKQIPLQPEIGELGALRDCRGQALRPSWSILLCVRSGAFGVVVACTELPLAVVGS